MNCLQKNITLQIFHYGIVLLCSLLFSTVTAQDSSALTIEPVQNAECMTNAVFIEGTVLIPFCLDNFIPLNDSCAEIQFNFLKYGVKVTFNLDMYRHWICTGTTVDSSQSQVPVFNASLSYDKDGILTDAVFNLNKQFDSSVIDLKPDSDIKSNDDTILSIDYKISRSTFICNEKIIVGKLVIREYTYPPGYGQRGQLLNYPELAAFHWGDSVKMPTGGGELQVRAHIANYWHLQTHLPIVYDDPKKLRKSEIFLNKWRERHPPRKKKKRNRKPFLKIKSL